MTPPNITLAQLNPTVGDIDGNCQKIISIWDQHENADLIIFSELIITGYPCDDLVLDPNFMARVHDAIDQLVRQSTNRQAAILISTPWLDNGSLYNAALLIEQGDIKYKSYKHHLPNYGVFDEKRVFRPGALPDIYNFHGTKLGILTCEDLWFPDVAAHLKGQGADILIGPNGSPFYDTAYEARMDIATARVQETGLPLIYVNQIGGQDELVFDGGSFVMNAKGEVTAQLPFFNEAVVSLSDAPIYTPLPYHEKIYNAAVLGLKDYVNKNGFPSVLIGLSGGIDSALTAAIAVDALGADRVHCVMMPSPYTSQESLDDAQSCANALGVKLDNISIETAMQAYHAMLDPYIDADNAGTTFENIQSRARGMILMSLSNAIGAMVVTTGNKSEMAAGYATLYGDMCGGFNPLKDMYKTTVYDIACWRNESGIVIPERIITKAPSAELKPDQCDQDSLPPYEVLDDILCHLIEKLSPIDDIPHDLALVQKISKMLKNAEYKRFQSPTGVKLTAKAFGRDRRYPMVNGF